MPAGEVSACLSVQLQTTDFLQAHISCVARLAQSDCLQEEVFTARTGYLVLSTWLQSPATGALTIASVSKLVSCDVGTER